MRSVCVLLFVCVFSCGKADPPFPSVDLTSNKPPAELLQLAEYYYEMVKQSKPEDYFERCIKATTAMAAAALAEDRRAYLKWSAIEKEDCKKVGL